MSGAKPLSSYMIYLKEYEIHAGEDLWEVGNDAGRKWLNNPHLRATYEIKEKFIRDEYKAKKTAFEEAEKRYLEAKRELEEAQNQLHGK